MVSNDPASLTDIIDADALRQYLTELTEDRAGDDPKTRAKALQALKEALKNGRAHAENRLAIERSGRLCAERLSYLVDELIRVLYDFAINHVYIVKNPTEAERITVLAVGGYGRGTLAPGSDIDLLFLLPYKLTSWSESLVEYMLYMLWDLGLKVGHATRNIDECMRQAKDDMTVRTSLLEARFLYGNASLHEALMARLDKEIFRNTGPEFIEAKLSERDTRHERAGSSRYKVEPNIKEGKGGLRDLHTLFWIGKYFYRVQDAEELVAKGVFSAQEYKRFRYAEDFLWSVRCHLHFLTRRADDRLSFDLQRDIAQRLGYTEHPGMQDVERFMKHYFLIAKTVGDLTRIFCSGLEEQHVKQAPILNRFLARIAGRGHKKLSETGDFIVEHGRINALNDKVFRKDPVNLIRVFFLADKHNLGFHPDVMRLITRSLNLIKQDVREDETANRLFLKILTSRNAPEQVLRRMNEAGVLGRFIPEFGKIVAMMQFNMYHHYTVDEHLLYAVGVLSAIERGRMAKEHPLSHELFPKIQNRKVLYVATLLHDIAKGRPEDHSIAGAEVARSLCPRLGLTAAETDSVAWLVQEHLTMSNFAQSRDLADRKTIQDFANIVQSMERLKLLLILTVADIQAVGPGVWNGWKGQLLRTLYYETEPLLSGGHSQLSRQERVEAAQGDLQDALNWPDEKIAAYFSLHYPAYWLRTEHEARVRHAHLIDRAETEAEPFAYEAFAHDFEAITELTVLADDHPRLLSNIAGACAVKNANIAGALINTTARGQALDTILIRRELPEDEDELRRADSIGQMILKTLTGQTRLPNIVARHDAKHSAKTDAFHVETEITVDNSSSNRFTVLEVSGLDRPGLLFDLTLAIADLNLDIASAQIVTFGEKAVDVFYVTDLFGEKVRNQSRINTIRRRMRAVFEGEEDSPPLKPAYQKLKGQAKAEADDGSASSA